MKYYFFYLEIALKDKDDLNIYAFENLSHIPTQKLIEIFNIDLEKDPNMLKGYFLTKASYKKHREYIKANMVPINLDKLEYCLRQYGSDNDEEIRKMYKLSLME